MNLTDINTVKRLLSKHGFSFQKSLGQNFIINPDICPMMAELSGAAPGTGVIEIGPGLGVLTVELASRCDAVASIELDARLLALLAETLSDYRNVQVIHADVLKTDLNEVIRRNFAQKTVNVCANLPYYITSPVIMYLLESRLPVENITVMVQKEAAQRICAPVGDRKAGALTVAVNYYAEAQPLFEVKKDCFMPRPKVDSEVIRLKVRKAPPVELKDEKFFFAMVKAAFSQRRKTALNGISAGLSIPKAELAAALEKSGFSPAVRAETLTMKQLADLSNILYEIR